MIAMTFIRFRKSELHQVGKKLAQQTCATTANSEGLFRFPCFADKRLQFNAQSA